jgi:sorbitol-specific phosphotransferase system component IIBC
MKPVDAIDYFKKAVLRETAGQSVYDVVPTNRMGIYIEKMYIMRAIAVSPEWRKGGKYGA